MPGTTTQTRVAPKAPALVHPPRELPSSRPFAAGAPRAAVGDVLRSPGQPLDAGTRVRMESRFGHDFGHVRVHDDTQAATAAAALGARAFTAGEHIAFSAGRYRPSTDDGARLIAHELAHVVQQGRGVAASASALDAEPRARSAAEVALSGRAVVPSTLGAAPLGLYRDEEPGLLGREPRFTFKLSDMPVATLDEFGFNSDAVTQAHRDKLGFDLPLFAPLLGEFKLTGHTDAVGSEAYNQGLGQRRADNVAKVLTDEFHIGAFRITTDSAGSTQPIVPTKQAEGKNRRVEVRFAPLAPSTGAGQPYEFNLPPLFGPRPSSTDLGSAPGARKPYDFNLPPGYNVPPGDDPGLRPPFKPRSAVDVTPTPAPDTKPPPGGPAQTRPGGAGDALDALLKVPEIKKVVDAAKDKVAKDLGGLSTGDKIATGVVAGSIVTGALGGLLSNAEGQAFLKKLLNGTAIPIPGTNGALKLTPILPATGGAGATFTIDILKLGKIPGLNK